MSDLFREVDEELRRDRAVELWKRYGPYVVVAAVAIVVATGAYVAWRDYTQQQAAEQGTAFFAATALASSGATKEAISAFEELAVSATTGYATLARMREAALKADAGEREAAIGLYRSVAEDSGATEELREAARLLAALHGAEAIDPGELERQLKSVHSGSSPWRHSALELLALAATRVGDTAKARELFEQISDDPTAPAALRARAAEMIAILDS